MTMDSQTWGVVDNQISKPKYLDLGQVKWVSITAGGTGYSASDAVEFTAAPAKGVTATGTLVVDGTGKVTEVKITNPGAGYINAPTLTVTTATGSGLVVVNKIAHVIDENTEIVFVDVEEAQLKINRIKGIRTPGWNKVTSRVVGGQIRYSAESLVAISVRNAISGDADDDPVVADVELRILTQPANMTVISGDSLTFFVLLDDPVGATYSWQVQVNGKGAYTDLANTGPYGGTKTSTLIISNSSGLAGNRYRVVAANAAANAFVTSKGARLVLTGVDGSIFGLLTEDGDPLTTEDGDLIGG